MERRTGRTDGWTVGRDPFEAHPAMQDVAFDLKCESTTEATVVPKASKQLLLIPPLSINHL